MMSEQLHARLRAAKGLVVLLALIALPVSAMAQQRIHYGSDGRVVARCTTGTTQITCYGADGRVISRETRERRQ